MGESETKIKLHWLNGSRAQSTLWLLEQLNIPYEIQVYHRRQDMLAPPELKQLHPLGKSPVVTVTPPGAAEPIVLAESAFIAQYLCEHLQEGRSLLPNRWKDGQEDKIGGETEEWLRHQYLLYYLEGSFMPWLVFYFIMKGLKGDRVPFFIRPVTKLIANQLISVVVAPNLKRCNDLMEKYLETSAGDYICGSRLTAADILLGYPLILGTEPSLGYENITKWDKGTYKETYPKLYAYARRLAEEAGYKKSVDKIKEIEGEFSLLPVPGAKSQL